MDSDLCGVQSGGIRQLSAGISHCGKSGGASAGYDLSGRLYHQSWCGEYSAGGRQSGQGVRGGERTGALSFESAGEAGGGTLCGVQLLYGDEAGAATGHDQCPQSNSGSGTAF